MLTPLSKSLAAAVALLAFASAGAEPKDKASGWQETFDLSKCTMATSGRNGYFVLEPGYQLVLQDPGTKLQITVLEETKMVAGVLTRVVEEKEWKDGKLHEIARNYFAICDQTKDVYYFGEDVDFYENGKVVKHDGSWQAGGRNKHGLMMSGSPRVKMKYFQEIAPGVAMDRAEIVSMEEHCKTPAGAFPKCMKVKEGSTLEPLVTEYKFYAPDIGFIGDNDMKLVSYGFVKK